MTRRESRPVEIELRPWRVQPRRSGCMRGVLVLAVSVAAFGAALALYLLTRQPPPAASPTATPSLTPVTTPTPTLVVVTVPPPTRTVQRQRLIIPWLEVNTQIVEMPIRYGQWQIDGLGDRVGHLAGTAPPGSAGNAVIAGHITLPDNRYGPFADLANLPVGSEVIVQDGAHRYVYAVESSQVVAMDDLSVVAPADAPTLTLLTCTGWDIPLQTYVERVIVVARLVQEQ